MREIDYIYTNINEKPIPRYKKGDVLYYVDSWLHSVVTHVIRKVEVSWYKELTGYKFFRPAHYEVMYWVKGYIQCTFNTDEDRYNDEHVMYPTREEAEMALSDLLLKEARSKLTECVKIRKKLGLSTPDKKALLNYEELT